MAAVAAPQRPADDDLSFELLRARYADDDEDEDAGPAAQPVAAAVQGQQPPNTTLAAGNGAAAVPLMPDSDEDDEEEEENDGADDELLEDELAWVDAADGERKRRWECEISFGQAREVAETGTLQHQLDFILVPSLGPQRWPPAAPP